MTSKTAIKILIGLLIAVVLFHLCIMLKLIPYDIAWGGRLENDEQMYAMESISIAVNLFLIGILLIKGRYIKALSHPKLINIILWVFLVLFALNTVGNIFAKTNFEKCFAVLTLVAALLLWVILRKSPPSPDTSGPPKEGS